MRQVSNYQKAEKALQEIEQQHIKPKRDHPYLSQRSLKAYGAIQKELSQSRKAIEKLIGSDPYAEKILEVFEGRVGQGPSPDELAKLHADAQQRYDQQVPPGFLDLKEKAAPDAYGDFIGWHQLMEIAKAEKMDIILVVDDFKEDWWNIERDRTIGPRPELLEEFFRVTGQRLHMYTSENFLWAAKKFVAADIREDVIEEVRQRLADQRQSGRIADPKPLGASSHPMKATAPTRAADDKPTELAKATADLVGSYAEKPKAQNEGDS
jgi:hypothetical protein